MTSGPPDWEQCAGWWKDGVRDEMALQGSAGVMDHLLHPVAQAGGAIWRHAIRGRVLQRDC